MRIYEIVLDGELTSDLLASVGPIHRREERGATVLSIPVEDRPTLEDVLGQLESLGIGITAMTEVEDPPKTSGSRHAVP
jgi:hypothetical protein